MGRGNPLQSAAVDAIGRVFDKPKLTLEGQVKKTLQKQHGRPDFDPSPTSYQRQLPLGQQADILIQDINTQTKLNGSNTRIEPELVDMRPNSRRFDDVETAKRYAADYIQEHNWSSAGMDEIWVKDTALESYSRKRFKGAKKGGLARIGEEGLDESGKVATDEGWIKLTFWDKDQLSQTLRRAREEIPEEDIWAFFTKIGRRERAQDFIDWVKTTNASLDAQRKQMNTERGSIFWSIDHEKALANEGQNFPSNRSIGPYNRNVSTQHKQDLPDEVLRASGTAFTWEEEILKWLDPTVGHFFPRLSDQQKATLIAAVENIEELRIKADDPTLTVTDVVDDLMTEWNALPTRNRDKAIRNIVGKSGKKSEPQWDGIAKIAMRQMREGNLPEARWRNGNTQFTWSPEDLGGKGRGYIDIIKDATADNDVYALKRQFFKQIEDLPSGTEWTLEADTAQKYRMYKRMFRNDPRITPGGDTKLLKERGIDHFILRIP